MVTRTLCITYDIPATSNYDPLLEHLREFPGYLHRLESTWFVRTKKSCRVVRDEIESLIPEGGKAIVFEVGATWASFRLPESAAKWLHKYWDPADD